MSKTFEGGCHCGAVRFRATFEEPLRALDCNCSICRKKGYLHAIVPSDRFELLAGAEQQTTYTFNTGVAKHHFCATCGIHSFYVPRSHPDSIDVNVRALDGDALLEFATEPFDGQNWEENVGAIR